MNDSFMIYVSNRRGRHVFHIFPFRDAIRHSSQYSNGQQIEAIQQIVWQRTPEMNAWLYLVIMNTAMQCDLLNKQLIVRSYLDHTEHHQHFRIDAYLSSPAGAILIYLSFKLKRRTIDIFFHIYRRFAARMSNRHFSSLSHQPFVRMHHAISTVSMIAKRSSFPQKVLENKIHYNHRTINTL